MIESAEENLQSSYQPIHYVYDDLLKQVGQFGRYQMLQLFFLWIVMLVDVAHGFVFVFVGAEPEHRCKLKDRPRQWGNLTDYQVNELAYPTIDSGRPSRCWMLTVNETDWSSGNFSTWVTAPTRNITQCTDGWSYESDIYKTTIVSEWDLVCDRSWYQSLITSVFFTGRLVGSTISGHFSDRIGRRPVFLMTLLVLCLAGVVTAFCNAVWLFCLLYFVQGAAQMSLASLIIIIGSELVGPNWRTFAASSCQVAYVTGEILLGVIAYLMRDWKMIQLTVGVMTLPLLSAFWFLPESARWLFSVNKTTEAGVVLAKMTKINKTEINQDLVRSVLTSKSGPRSNVSDIFKTWTLANVALIIWFNSFAHHVIYHGFHINAPNLAGNPYFNFFISGCVEMLSLVLAIILQEKLGRRFTFLLYGAISAVGGVAAIFIPLKIGWLSTTALMTVKFGVAGAINVLEIMTVEVFPTALRNIGYGISKSLAHAAGMIAPYIVLLKVVNSRSPQIVFGALALVVAILGWFVPETTNKQLLQTIDEVKGLVNGEGGAGGGDDWSTKDNKVLNTLQLRKSEEHKSSKV